MSKAAVTDQRGRSENKIVQILTKNPRITAFLVLAIASTVLSKGIFLSPANLHNMLRQYASIGIMAVGQTIVILLAGVDLSQGAMIALVSMVVAYLNVNGYGLIIPLLAGLGIGALGGLLSGTIITKAKVPPFIATLAVANIAKGCATLMTQSVPFTAFLLSCSSSAGIPFSAWVFRLWSGSRLPCLASSFGPDRLWPGSVHCGRQ